LELHGQIHTEVTLTDSERQIAEFVAQRRFDGARDKNIHNNRKGPQSNYETDLEGMASELAAAKALNVWPDLTEEIQVHDLTYNGVTIDVKATKYHTGRLIAGLQKKNKSCDYYMLLVGECPTYDIKGFAKREDLLSEDTITDLGWGKLHALTQDKLTSLSNFLKEFHDE
jgi:hypothetical protein|tara:strand:+ start:582 stop:1091 length:510 start_codon:yes stop_codon:yes gene_type:complete